MSGFCFGHVFHVLVSIGIDCTDSPFVFFLMGFICLFDNKNSISQYMNTFFSHKISCRLYEVAKDGEDIMDVEHAKLSNNFPNLRFLCHILLNYITR